jgi:hypothetical protein
MKLTSALPRSRAMARTALAAYPRCSADAGAHRRTEALVSLHLLIADSLPENEGDVLMLETDDAELPPDGMVEAGTYGSLGRCWRTTMT